MNNEEKNLTPETSGVEENNQSAPTGQANEKKGLSKGLLAAIIGGAALVLVAIILLIVLLPGNNGANQGNGDGGEGNVQPDTEVTYTVTVVDQNGNPVPAAIVNLHFESGKTLPCPTEADGKASYKGDDKVVSASVLTVPGGYEYNKMNQKQNLDSQGKLTVTVTKKEAAGVKYTIYVVDENNNPVANVKVQMCVAAEGGTCLTPILFTNENGEVVYTAAENSYKAIVSSLPEGYEAINNEYVYLVDGVATIVVKAVAAAIPTASEWEQAFLNAIEADNITYTWHQINQKGQTSNDDGFITIHKDDNKIFMEGACGPDGKNCYTSYNGDEIYHYSKDEENVWTKTKVEKLMHIPHLSEVLTAFVDQYDSVSFDEATNSFYANSIEIYDIEMELTVKIENGNLSYLSFKLYTGKSDDIDTWMTTIYEFSEYGTTSVTLPDVA